MALEVGSTLGHYEVLSSLGAGGMGEVYRAKDTKLGREVAIKLLLDEVSADPERLARFDREARVLASLNHNNIASLHAFERDGDTSFLVMELVEGETLAERIERGPIAVDEALPLFLQIAEGLEAAHEKGVIHRDLKPANVKVADDGNVKILDFGLAKAMAPEIDTSEDGGLSESPTLTLAATQRGEILGTAAYMSPEQAKGKTVDKRADIWTFGACLYEALTGERAFQGGDAPDTLAAVLRAELDWEELAATPSAIQRLLRRCLKREPNERLRDIGDARIEIEEAIAAPEGDEPTPDGAAEKRSPIPLALATLAAGAVIAGLATWALKPEPRRPLVRSVLSAPPSAPVVVGPFRTDVAVTPDGRAVVYQAAGSLYVRRVGQLQGTALGGTEGAANPSISPDGAWVVFSQSNTLKKVSLRGGPPLAVLETPSGYPVLPSWEKDGTIFFTNIRDGGLYRLPSGGAEPELVAEPDREAGEQSLNWPELLPGGRALLFVVRTETTGFDQSQLAVLDLETGERKVLLQGAGRAVYVPTGHLVYTVEDGLLAVVFDPVAVEVLSDPVSVLEGVVTKGESNGASFALSDDGSLVYVSGTAGAAGQNTLVWLDREGREEPVGAPPRNYLLPTISPDGERVAVSDIGEQQDVWIWDFRRQTESRLTRDPSLEAYSVWTRDSREVIFSAMGEGNLDLYRKAADGTGKTERLTEHPGQLYPDSLSPDGRVLVYGSGIGSGFDLGVLELDGGEPRPLLAEDFDERNGDISPDGRFLAYQSNESGQDEIYVRPFPEVDSGRFKISTGGGREPLWSEDGRELYYRTPESAVMAVAIATAPEFRAGTPQELFRGPYQIRTGRNYDVAPDGRFLMIKAAVSDDGPRNDVVLVQNWTSELERLVPTD